MKITLEMVSELDLDLAAIISKCEEKANAARDTLEAIYAERRTKDNYGLKIKEEEIARRQRQRYCQWRDAWNQTAQNIAELRRRQEQHSKIVDGFKNPSRGRIGL